MDETHKDLEAFGAPTEVLALAQPKALEVIVFEDNWTAVELFQRLVTQWVWGAGGGAMGLNYSSLEFLFTIYKTRKRREVFESIQIMELAALQVFNEQRE